MYPPMRAGLVLDAASDRDPAHINMFVYTDVHLNSTIRDHRNLFSSQTGAIGALGGRSLEPSSTRTY